jgi:hypothetical protein
MGDHRIHEHRREIRTERTSSDRGKLLPTNRMPEKSPFQKVLDETNLKSDLSAGYHQPTAAATREAVKPVLSQQERYGHDRQEFERRLQEHEGKRDDSRSADSKGTEGPRAKEAEKRVVARGATGERRQEGRGEGGGQAGGGLSHGKKGKEFMTGPELKGLHRGETAEGKAKLFTMEMQAARTAAQLGAKQKSPTTLPKALLDQIVQYCRLVIKTDGDKEFDIQLHEEVFKGLRLKVALEKGKIQATFVTSSQEIRGLFLARKSALRQALSEKGIDVASINVIMV